MRPAGARQIGETNCRVVRAPLVVAIAIAVVLCTAVAAVAHSPSSGHTTGVAPRPEPAPQDTGRPAVTLLYQNFPNPFPSIDSRTTCIWFDLNRSASVKLTVHDIRGNLVRQLLPTASSPPIFSPGRYGRASASSGTGCDPTLTWDGRADDGTVVPRGVYLIRLRAGGAESIKKAVFQGT